MLGKLFQSVYMKTLVMCHLWTNRLFEVALFLWTLMSRYFFLSFFVGNVISLVMQFITISSCSDSQCICYFHQLYTGLCTVGYTVMSYSRNMIYPLRIWDTAISPQNTGAISPQILVNKLIPGLCMHHELLDKEYRQRWVALFQMGAEFIFGSENWNE